MVAKRLHIGPPSDTPRRTASREPAAAITARTSSMRCSSVGSAPTRSDRPVPRLSNRMTRENSDEPTEKTGEGRLGPEAIEMRHPPHHEHEIDGSAADDLIRDVDVTAVRVVGRRRFRRRLCGR